jgi:beta-lactamase regulating signal transducer with metallopeptidase domain
MNPDWFFHIIDRFFIWSLAAIPVFSDLMLYSTIIGIIGLAGSFLLKGKGAVYQSLFLRISLLAIIVTPLAALIFSSLDIKGIHLPLALVKSPDTLMHSIKSGSLSHEKIIFPQKEPAPSKILQESSRNSQTNSQTENYTAPSLIGKKAYPLKNTVVSEVGKASNDNSAKGYSSIPVKAKEEKKSVALDIVIFFIYIIISLAWIFFSLYLLIKAVIYNLYIRHLLVTSYDANPIYVKTSYYLAEELNIRPPRILQNPLVTRAFLAGIIHPSIVLPLNEHEATMSSREVFIHEFAHMIRHDCLWGLICQAAKILLPLQPLIWLISKEIEVTGEYACDDYVVVHGKTDEGYAHQLYTIASHFQPAEKEINVGLGIFSVRSYLLERIERILDKSRTRYLTAKLHEVLSFIVLFFSSVVLTGFFSFRSEAVKHQATNGNSYTQKKKTIMSLKEEIKSGYDSFTAKIKQQDSDNTAARPHPGENTDPVDTIRGTDEKSESKDITPHLDMTESDNVSAYSGNTNPGLLTVEQAKTDLIPEIARHSELSAFPSSSERIAVHEDIKSPVSEEIKNENGIYKAILKPEAAELKISPGFGNNPIPQQSISEQFTSLVNLSQDFQSIVPLDSRARTLHFTSTSTSQLDPVWSPDSKKIAFTDGKYGVWVVPSEGGEPVLVYDNYYKSQWKGIKFHYVGSMDTFCFSADGQNLLFQYYVIDETRGTKVTTLKDEYGYLAGYKIDGLIPFIMSVDIRTGVVNTVREEADKGLYSSNGKYLGFINYDHRILTDPSESFHVYDLTILDTEKNEIFYLTNGQYKVINFCFAPDNSSVIACLTPKDGSAPVGLYRIPIHGGKAERIRVDLENGSCDDLQCSANGEWLIYTEKKSDRQNIVYYNLLTGAQRCKPLQTSTKIASLSPDGEKYCAVMETGGTEPAFRLFTSASLAIPAGVETIAPVGFALKGNFPNPFNQSTVIEYTLQESGKVSLEIYNVLGQKIRQLVSETMQPGRHSVRWDGRTDDGRTVSSGNYIMRLNMGKFTVTKNMTMIK